MFDTKSTSALILTALLAYYVYKVRYTSFKHNSGNMMLQVVYSLFFCPLRKVPGPLRVHFFPSYHKLKILNGTLHQYTLDLHKRFGTVVRIGGDTVSMVSESARKEIYSTYNFSKGKIYESNKIIGENMFNTNNKDYHRLKKRILAPLFSDKAISSVENIIHNNVKNLVEKLNDYSYSNQKFDLGLYFHYFSFDVIGDIGFGKSFNMVNDGYHPVIGWVKDTFYLSFILFIFPIFKNIQFRSVKSLYEFSYGAINNAKSHPNRATIMNALLNAVDPETGKKLDEKEIAEESIIQFAAGTDTTSNTLTWFFYNLTNHPDIYEKLEREINTIFQDKASISYTQIKSDCHYLNAVIHESMRVTPVAPGNLPRAVPKGGRVIDGYFIPEGTTIGSSVISCHNLPELWKDPNVFNPGRWLENGKFKTNPNFFSFSIGPRACIGRSLAWMELYLVIATLIRNFRFKRENNNKIDSSFYLVAQPVKPIIYTVQRN
ncbi:cytochrome P450 [Neoconidiobolus thromboides FSU 785]|nr:cytochrome P450 [Neoconidiobolus thromboides FSU 785]